MKNLKVFFTKNMQTIIPVMVLLSIFTLSITIALLFNEVTPSGLIV